MSSWHTHSLSSFTKRVEADTVQKARFFHAIGHLERKSIPIVCREDVELNTGKSNSIREIS
jgi:hypothetical protein